MQFSPVLTTEDLRRLVSGLPVLRVAVDDAERVERLRLLEELKSAAAAAQALEAVAFAASQRAGQAVAGVPVGQQGRGVAAQVGLALRLSPWRAARWLGWATILTRELPGTFAELAAGRTSEWRTMLVARETAVLSRQDRARVDAAIAPRLQGCGDRQVEGETRRMAQRLDPAAAVARARRATGDRRVTIRPAPDTMCRLTTIVPVAEGVATYAALTRQADTAVAAGDPRSRGQLMADTLVQRVTGQRAANAVPVEIVLVMTDTTLLNGHNITTDQPDGSEPGGNEPGRNEPGGVGFGGFEPGRNEPGRNEPGRDEPGGNEPGLLLGYGPIPAGTARDLALGGLSGNGSSGSGDPPRWLRRLYTHPSTGQLIAMDSRRREFTTAQRLFLRLRDQTCRTPWCHAPIRHTDHIQPHAHGGATTITNGQGLCVACNHAKQAPGWHTTTHNATITTHTPTGHRYDSHTPNPPGHPGRPRPTRRTTRAGPPQSAVELRLRELLAAA